MAFHLLSRNTARLRQATISCPSPSLPLLSQFGLSLFLSLWCACTLANQIVHHCKLECQSTTILGASESGNYATKCVQGHNFAVPQQVTMACTGRDNSKPSRKRKLIESAPQGNDFRKHADKKIRPNDPSNWKSNQAREGQLLELAFGNDFRKHADEKIGLIHQKNIRHNDLSNWKSNQPRERQDEHSKFNR